MSLGHGHSAHHSRVTLNQISTQKLKDSQLVVSLVAVYWIAHTIFWYVFNRNGNYLFPTFWEPRALVVVIYFIATLPKMLGEVTMNRALVLLDNLTKSGRAVFEGNFRKMPWETVQYEIDLETELTSDIAFTFPTNDNGTVSGKVSVLSKPESAEGWDELSRSERMLTYVKYQHEIQPMQKAHAEEIMRMKFAQVTAEEAKNMPKTEILNKEDFEEITYLMAFRVEEINIKDLDYGSETQEAKDAILRATTLMKVRALLQAEGTEGGGLTLKEANDTALLMSKDTKFQKTMYDFTLNGLSDFTPETAQAILEFAKHLKS